MGQHGGQSNKDLGNMWQEFVSDPRRHRAPRMRQEYRTERPSINRQIDGDFERSCHLGEVVVLKSDCREGPGRGQVEAMMSVFFFT